MRILYGLLLGSMLFGQLGGIVISPGIVVYVHDFVCVILFLVSLVSWIKKSQTPKLLVPICIFIGVSLLSLIVQYSRFTLNELLVSSLYLWRWVLYAGVYFFILRRSVAVNLLARGLFLYGCGFALIGIVQFVVYPDLRNLWYLGWDPHYFRLFSTFLDPNFAGILLSLSVLLGIYLWQVEHKRRYIVGILFLWLSIYLTYSRSSYLGAVLGVIVYFLLQKQWKIFVIVALFIAAILIIPTPGGKTLRLDRYDSTISRIQNWQESFSLFATSPVLGHGFNTLRLIQTPPRLKYSDTFSRATGGVDSSILFLLVTTGIVGLASYSWLLYAVISNKKNSRILQLYVSTLVAIVTHSVFTNSLFYPWVMIWLWIVVGMVEITYDT